MQFSRRKNSSWLGLAGFVFWGSEIYPIDGYSWLTISVTQMLTSQTRYGPLISYLRAAFLLEDIRLF